MGEHSRPVDFGVRAAMLIPSSGQGFSALRFLVFSDLDGTLLDHATYSWEPARPGLDRLRALGAGVVLASSKTAAEIRPLQTAMGIDKWPAIVENGAGTIGLKPGDFANLGNTSYRNLRALLGRAPPGFRGFGDMTDQEVSERTGLPLDQAARARQRQFSEPGVWEGSEADLSAFTHSIEAMGLHARRGGRFLTVSFGRTKADAMAEIIAHDAPKTTIALGDAPNDIEMLEAADWGVVVRNPHAPALSPLAGEADGRIIRTRATGPEGWAEAILQLTPNPGEP